MKSSFDWTRERIHLLGKLRNVLSGTLKQWGAFTSPDGGDIGYFFDLEHPFPSESTQSVDTCHAGRSLSAIKKTFVNLDGLLQKIDLLRDDLSRDFETVSGTVNDSFGQAQLCRRRYIADHLIFSLNCVFPWKVMMQTSMPRSPQHS
jgi:hypothetical protein